MQTSFKTITNIQSWRLAAITIGSALAIAVATTASAAGPKPSITSPNTASGNEGVAFSYQITATNGPTGYSTTVSVPGVSFSTSTGLFSGTSTTAGTYSGTISATNGNGTGSQNLTVTINGPPHTAPTAIATISPTAVYTGDIVTLDASTSHTNPSGSPLTYQWQQQAPANPTISLAPNMTAMTATFTAPNPGAGLSEAVTFRVKVTDDLASGGDKNTNSDPATTTVYALPVANAGPDQAISIRETEVKTVYLNGTGTISRGAITFSWTQTGGPAVTWLTPTDIANPSFQTTGTGGPMTALTFNLVVSDGTRLSTDDQVGVKLNTVANNVPVANAGADQSVEEHDPVTLNGSGTDADSDLLSFHWTQDSGVAVVLTGADTATPTFTAPDVPNGQNSTDLVFKLVLNDGFSDSVPSFVTVHVDNTNDAPVALAKAGLTVDTLSQGPVNVNQGEHVLLDGNSSSDINGDTLSYSWTELSNTIAIANANTANASFTATAPVGGASYDFKLTVSDGEFTSDSIVHVNVAHVNHDPIADAGPDQPGVPEGTLVQLNGSNSGDEDGNTLTYSWTQTGGTDQVTPTGADTATPSFTAPDVGPDGEDLTFELTVYDGQGGSATDTVTITVQYVNSDPVAEAGPSQTPDENTVVTLDGSGSSDPDGNSLHYSWSQIGGLHTVSLSDATALQPTFSAPEVTLAEDDIVMQLTVTDDYGGSSTDDVTIHIHNVNHPPVADAGANFSVQWGHMVSLSGSGTDPDVEEQPDLTYAWTPPAGVTLSGTGANVSFTAPPVPGPMYEGEQVLTFSLRVTDPNGAHSDDTIDVTVTNNGFSPSADAGSNQTVDEHSNVTLHGSGSDPNNDPIHFTWTKITPTAPDLDDPTSPAPSFTAPFVGPAGTTLTYQLLVWDDFGGWGLDSVTVTVNNINNPPDITNAHADVGVLWAPDHKLVPVHIVGVTDTENNATVTITGVTQDEPTNGLGDGDTAIDAIISTNHDAVQLRAERSGTGNGRVYRVYFTASDFEGGSSGYVTVMVPKSKKTDVAIDSGQNYNSTH